MLNRIALLAGILTAAILCSITTLAWDERPRTGTVITGGEMEGRGELVILNNGADDAVAALIENRTGIVVAAVYIRGKENFRLTGIIDGIYDLYFKQGEIWNMSLERFETNARQSRMDEPLTFETTRIPEGVRYSMAQVTINEVP